MVPSVAQILWFIYFSVWFAFCLAITPKGKGSAFISRNPLHLCTVSVHVLQLFTALYFTRSPEDFNAFKLKSRTKSGDRGHDANPVF
jgi:hypothetical protein